MTRTRCFPARPLRARHACTFAAMAFMAFMTLGGVAHASDVDCDPASTKADPLPAHRLICESALFSMGDQRIHAEQQRLLRTGAITDADIAGFRQKRDRCESASCLDKVFREWRAAVASQGARKP